MKSGIREPLTVTQAPPRTVGSGLCVVDAVLSLKFEPSTLINPPAVKRRLRSAVFTTLSICGEVVVASKFEGSTGKPDCVSRIIAFPFAKEASERVKAMIFGSLVAGG